MSHEHNHDKDDDDQKITPHNHSSTSHIDLEPKHSTEVLAQKIIFLEEELVRKEKIIDNLRKENDLLFKTALKNSQDKVNQLKPD